MNRLTTGKKGKKEELARRLDCVLFDDFRCQVLLKRIKGLEGNVKMCQFIFHAEEIRLLVIHKSLVTLHYGKLRTTHFDVLSDKRSLTESSSNPKQAKCLFLDYISFFYHYVYFASFLLCVYKCVPFAKKMTIFASRRVAPSECIEIMRGSSSSAIGLLCLSTVILT